MKTRLSRVQVIRAQHLLNMHYAPSEIADEIGIDVKQIYRSLIPAGCPHVRDDDGKRLWIIGGQFREWARANAATSRDQSHMREKMPSGQAYCFKCRRRVTMKDAHIEPTSRCLELVRGHCAECGGNVNRAQKRTVTDGQSG